MATKENLLNNGSTASLPQQQQQPKPIQHTQPTSPHHAHSHSQPQLPNFMKFPSSPLVSYHNPISHFSNQYTANSNKTNKIFYNNNMRHAVNVSGNASAYTIPPPHAQKAQQNNKNKQKNAHQNQSKNKSSANGKNNHARNASLSMSYIQQQQQHFFMEQPMPSDSNSDDDIYEDMIKDGLGANSQHIQQQQQQQQNAHKKQKKSSIKHNKSRKETEDVWCCAVCTYQNNMLLGYCELCGCKKPETPSIVQVNFFCFANCEYAQKRIQYLQNREWFTLTMQ